MIHCKELNADFESIKDLHQALKANKKKVIQAKKGAIKYSDGMSFFVGKKGAEKEEADEKKLEIGDTIYPVINTINYLDSHMDVHLYGIWKKSVEEQAGKVALIMNHDYKVGKVIAFPEDVVPMIKEMDWRELGRDYEGKTEALIFQSKLTEDSAEIAFKMYRNKRAVQHSVSMEYVKVELAVNSDDEDWKQERANYEKYFPLIVNPEKAIKFGYFWAVQEAKIYREGSMVLQGSNDATPTLYSIGAEKFTPAEEPTNVTPERVDKINQLINLLKS
jgi:hypothetical protein